jgi:hypothetical protein
MPPIKQLATTIESHLMRPLGRQPTGWRAARGKEVGVVLELLVVQSEQEPSEPTISGRLGSYNRRARAMTEPVATEAINAVTAHVRTVAYVRWPAVCSAAMKRIARAVTAAQGNVKPQ